MPADLGVKDTNELAAPWNRKPQQLLGRQAECVLLVHGGDVIQPVEISDRLQVAFVLDELFGSAMQKADMRINALHHLAVKFKYET